MSDDTWNENGEIIVRLGPALAALTGDPTSTDSQTFELLLTTRVPGVLDLRQHAKSLRFISRVAFEGQSAKPISTTSEGRVDLPLALPDPEAGHTRTIESVRAVVAGELSEERILPPVGPDPAPLPGALNAAAGPLAELVLDSHRAACLELDHDARLSELVAVRLPLAASADGAEARVVLWQSNEAGQPSEVLENGTSAAVPLDSESETWVTFTFDEAIEIDPANPPWAAILVTRGTVTSSLASADSAGSNALRRGPPSGPWKALPAPFQSTTSALGQLRGRVRISGHAPADAPVTAIELAVVPEIQPAPAVPVIEQPALPVVEIPGAEPPVVELPVLAALLAPPAPVVSKDVAPTAQGTAATLLLPEPDDENPPVAAARLRITNRVAGDLTIRDVDVIWSQSPDDDSEWMRATYGRRREKPLRRGITGHRRSPASICRIACARPFWICAPRSAWAASPGACGPVFRPTRSPWSPGWPLPPAGCAWPSTRPSSWPCQPGQRPCGWSCRPVIKTTSRCASPTRQPSSISSPRPRWKKTTAARWAMTPWSSWR